MKKRLIKTALFAFLALAVSGCSEDDSTGGNNGPFAGEVEATVGDKMFATSEKVWASFTDGTFNILAIDDATGETINITVYHASEGTFELGPNSDGNSAIYIEAGVDKSFSSAMEGGSGEITITELDSENKTVSGTFSFTGIYESAENGTEMVKITNGTFTSISYTLEMS
jgi:hypothetical protein